MSTYYRPNFTSDQVAKLSALIKLELERLEVSSPDFESLYRCFLKLKDCKPISTSRKESN